MRIVYVLIRFKSLNCNVIIMQIIVWIEISITVCHVSMRVIDANLCTHIAITV